MEMMPDVVPELATPPERERKKKKKKSKRRSESPEKTKSQRRKSESESGSEGESQRKPPRKEKRKERPDPDAGKQAKQRRRSRKLRTGTGKEAREEDVPIVGTAKEAALIIRSFAKQEEPIPSKFKFMWGPGMFEKTGFQDIVYTSLTETETGGSFARAGSVDSWNGILKQVPDRYWKDPARFFHALQAVLREQQTSDPVLALVAGAMISDVKHGITEWIRLLGELYPMLTKVKPGTDFRELFKQWYEYSGRGGRNQRGRERRPSYRDQPGRVKTIEWDQPTIIPSRGGFRFADVGPAPEFLKTDGWRIALTEGDPAFFWKLAMTNRYMYNLLADRWQTTRALMPT
jgi:hypothetical protein